MTDDRVSPIVLLEKVTTLNGKVEAAHGRVDKLEMMVRDDLNEIKEDLKELMGWMNRGKGWASASMVLSSMGGGIVAFLIGLLFKH